MITCARSDPGSASVNPNSLGSMASTALTSPAQWPDLSVHCELFWIVPLHQARPRGRQLRLAEQPIEVVAHHRLVLTALLKQEASQG